MPDEKHGMYWKIHDTTLIPVKSGPLPPDGGRRALDCPRLFLHIQDGIVGGLIIHPYHPFPQELRSRTEALPEQPLGSRIRHRPTCVMALWLSS